MATTSSPSPIDSFIAGSLSGMCAISVCHPLDVIRTNMQINQSVDCQSKSTIHLLRTILREKTVWNLYDGFLLPFCAQALYKAVIFSTNTVSSKYLFHGSKDAWPVFLSGALSGAVNSLLVAPIEIIRTTQIMNAGSSSSVQQCVSRIYNQSGLGGFWRGFLPTAARDGPGIGFYLLGFNSCKEYLSSNSSFFLLSPFTTRLVSGSVAGISFWLWALPIDTVKTVVESGRYGRLSPLQVAQRLVRDEGPGHLFRAWPAAMGRGVPSAAVTLMVYDYVADYLVSCRR